LLAAADSKQPLYGAREEDEVNGERERERERERGKGKNHPVR
jgi:hypothetical protein